jgi:hypothetical protein
MTSMETISAIKEETQGPVEPPAARPASRATVTPRT